MHPDLFRELDPDDTLEALLSLYRDVDLSGIYAGGMTRNGAQ